MENTFDPAVQPVDLALFWSRRTRGVRRFVNAAWLVESMLPNMFLACLGLTAAILLARRAGWSSTGVAVLAAVLILAAVGVALLRARRHFISDGEARAEIESGLRLHTRLSAAAAGVGAWPAVEQWRATLWRWHWRKLAVLPLCSAALLLAALWLPITPAEFGASKPPLALPPALERVESELQKLAATPEIDQPSLEMVREEAQQLARQDPADWYSHASLEAADHLKSKLESGMKALGDTSAKIERLLGKNVSESSAAWNEQLQGALSALQGNVPGLNKELAETLAGLDPSKMKMLTPEQIAQLKKSLREAKNAAGQGEKGEGEDGEGNQPGDGEGEGTEEGEGEGPGTAGVSRGPGTAPLKLGKSADLGNTKTESLPTDDLSKAALSEALGVTAGQHEVDKTKSAGGQGGTATVGEGAGAVWQQQHVTPEERKRLQEFFK